MTDIAENTPKKHFLRGWLRLIRLPHLLSVPGDVAIGFLPVWKGSAGSGSVPYGLLGILMAASALCFAAGGIANDLADLQSDCMERPNRPVPAHEVPIRAAVAAAVCAAVLAVCFSSVSPAACGVCILILAGAAAYDFSRDAAGGHKIVYFALCRLLNIGMGAAAAVAVLHDRGGMPELRASAAAFPAAAVFAAGAFFFWFGAAKAARERYRFLEMRPGFRLFLAGAVIAYAVLFWTVVRKPTSDWHLLACGGVSAVASAVFAVITYWCFRLFHYPVPPIVARRSLALLVFGWCFLQAAAAAAQDELAMAGIFAAAGILCRISAKKLEGDMKT